jgi:hypothetical protein
MADAVDAEELHKLAALRDRGMLTVRVRGTGEQGSPSTRCPSR